MLFNNMAFPFFIGFSKIRNSMMLFCIMYKTIVSCSYLLYDTETRPFLIRPSCVDLFVMYGYSPAEGFQQKLVAREF